MIETSPCQPRGRQIGCDHSGRSADILVAYAVAELKRRGVVLRADVYAALLTRFKNKRMTIQVMGYHALGDLPDELLPDELKLEDK